MITKQELSDPKLVDNTFPMDFTIAEEFWPAAVKDTFDRAFKEWKNNIKYATALSMALNHKIREWYEKKNNKLALLYQQLREQIDGYIYENYKWDDLTYYFKITD